MLSVRDTGCGMDPETLPAVRAVLHDQGGRQGHRPRPRHGLRHRHAKRRAPYRLDGARERHDLRPVLPARWTAGADRAGNDHTKPLHGREIILLVEDDDSVRALTLQVLQRQGYTVMEARNGPHALELCGEYHGALHLLITDMVMPDMNGRHLAESLCQQRADLRVLYMSGYAENSAIRSALAAEELDFIHKPFTPESLGVAVAQSAGSLAARASEGHPSLARRANDHVDS